MIETIKIISGFLTPIIAIIATYIAYQQYFINKQKLKLELYEKRYRIFNETKKVLFKINQDAQIGLDELWDFMFNTNDRVFLFNSEINEFILEIKSKAIEINHSTKRFQDLNKLPLNSKNDLIEKYALQTKWFTHEHNNIENRFFKYLNFKRL